MQCRFCERPSIVEPEHDNVRVGLCAHHIRECLETFETSPIMRHLEQTIDEQNSV